VPVERFMPESGAVPPGLLFIDLPGISAGDAAALVDLRARIAGFGPAQVHLVLNAAYESAVLLAQVRAFGNMGVMDLVATHLDEEPRWGKLWNWVIGTNCPLGWLSVGQNIPGEFRRADPGSVLSRQFARKT
jgi:flagellar biosynthesis GTPase FlhF